MTISQILPHIHNLQHADKLRLMQTLLMEIAREEGIKLDSELTEKIYRSSPGREGWKS
jgi:hypothetical protein